MRVSISRELTVLLNSMFEVAVLERIIEGPKGEWNKGISGQKVRKVNAELCFLCDNHSIDQNRAIFEQFGFQG